MDIEKITSRQTSVLIEHDELKFFYDILCIWEGSNKKPDCINFSDKQLSKYLSSKGLNLPHDKRNASITIEQSTPNKIQFKGRGNLCRTLIRHLRNAFAHNLIEKKVVQTPSTNATESSSEEYLHFQDWRKSECRMDGMMKFDDFKNLINIILKR